MAILKVSKANGQALVNELKYSGIGKCIYCGVAGPRLTDEHILPRGLNGYIVMRDASCDTCAKEILKFESAIMQKQYGMLRRYLGLRSRKKEEYKAPLIFKLRNGKTLRAKVKLEDYPLTVVCLNHIQGPTFERGSIEPTLLQEIHIKVRGDDETRRIVDRVCRKFGAISVSTPLEISADMLSRLICKVGHGLAVAQFGLDNFQPITVDYILGREQVPAGYYVGGVSGISIPSSSFNSLTMLLVGELNGKHAVYASVGLFAEIGFPIYTAIVGFLSVWDEDVKMEAGFKNAIVLD